MRIGGRRGARPAAAADRKRTLRSTRSPAFGPLFCIALLVPLVFAGAVGGAGPTMPGGAAPTMPGVAGSTVPGNAPSVRTAIAEVAAVSPAVPDLSGPVVIAMERPPADFRVAQGALSAPPSAMIVNAPGALGIPMIALSAYRNAEQKMAVAAPGCGISWNVLAGIGRIESGQLAGATHHRQRLAPRA